MKKVILTSLTLLLLLGCKSKEEPKPAPLRPVKYQVVGSSDAVMVRTFSAIAQAGDEIELSFRSSGIITELNVEVGDVVSKGYLIARLDNIQANLSYQQSISNVNSAQSTLNTTTTNLARIRTLYEKGSKSLREYESAKNEFSNAEAQYESAMQNKGIEATQVSFGFIYASASGTIVRKEKELNENVMPGQVIAVLNAGDELNIRVGLPESVINRVTMDMLARISFSAIDDTIEGRVFEISPVAERSSATYPVKLSIDNTNKDIRPGMAANVTFIFPNMNSNTDNPIIPVKAVGEDGVGNFVFLIESEGEDQAKVVKQYVELGGLTPEGFEVIKGLSNGQRIATAGLQTLLDNQKVRLTH
ncbi:MAG: efflux RND transporter periplasmic adaptor subunit [Bacteroidetes bacterium]|nr:efflux RND transporter periplasmic adaptor subunit [Bacteroidota bacterium]